MKKLQKYSKQSDLKIRKDEQEAFEIYSENCDGNFDILYYRDKFIFTNDYVETLSIINGESSSVWNRWKKFFESEYQNNY